MNLEQAVMQESYRLKMIKKEKESLMREKERNLSKVTNDIGYLESILESKDYNSFCTSKIQSLSFSSKPSELTEQSINDLNTMLYKTKEQLEELYQKKMNVYLTFEKTHKETFEDHGVGTIHEVAKFMSKII